MEETRFTTDDSQDGKTQLGDYAFNAPKTNFICLDLQKEEKKKY